MERELHFSGGALRSSLEIVLHWNQSNNKPQVAPWKLRWVLLFVVVVVVYVLTRVQPFVAPWTIVHQASLSMGFFRQEYWSGKKKNTGMGCHFLLQGIFLTQGWNLCLLHWQADPLPLSHQGSQVPYGDHQKLRCEIPRVPQWSLIGLYPRCLSGDLPHGVCFIDCGPFLAHRLWSVRKLYFWGSGCKLEQRANWTTALVLCRTGLGSMTW